MTVRVFLLHGGVQSWDGIVTSAGMNTVVNTLRKLPGVVVQTYLWQNYLKCYLEITRLQGMNAIAQPPIHDKYVLIGYSGGGMHVTWIARGYNGGPINLDNSYFSPQPHIDLLVAYDPSPKNADFGLGDNVERAICYHNTAPMMFGLGGGTLKRAHSKKPLEIIDIAQQHLMVQFNSTLHARTVAEVKKLC